MAYRLPETLERRREYSTNRLSELRQKIDKLDELSKLRDLCIYVTGSYGRHEASKYSDLDLFFIHQGTEAETSVPRIRKTLVDAALIKTCAELKFPEFSQDGRYLEIHYLEDIKSVLGSPRDDFENFFTARLLLLLESDWIFNERQYRTVLYDIIGTYYRDFHDHEHTFRPIFLVNDILRYWKTLCLNYEHGRNRPAEDSKRKNKNHLKNLKLKYSRMLMCFSTVIVLSRNRNVVTPEHLFDLIVGKPPLDRLTGLAEGGDLVERILNEYAWFLSLTEKPEAEILEWIANSNERNIAFERARHFGTLMYELVTLVGKDSDTLRYLVI